MSFSGIFDIFFNKNWWKASNSVLTVCLFSFTCTRSSKPYAKAHSLLESTYDEKLWAVFLM